MNITGNTMNEVYRRLCIELYLNGDNVSPRGLSTCELTNVQIELTDPRARVLSSTVRNMSMKYMVGELCFYLGGSTSLEQIAHYGPFWRQVSDDGVTVNSAYGRRLFGYYQFQYAVQCLITDAMSRKVVMPIYDATDSRTSKDNPCTMFLQLMIRRERLDCYTFMRSNDVWLGLPYDLAFFTFLQEMALIKLRRVYPDLQMGSYFHWAASMHCYEEHIEDLWAVYDERRLKVIEMPPVMDDDVETWFSALLEYEKAYRTHELGNMTPSGVQSWLAQYLR